LNQAKEIFRKLRGIRNDLNDDLRKIREKSCIGGILFEELRQETDLSLNMSLVFIFLEVNHFH
jgi:hypothetical protein